MTALIIATATAALVAGLAMATFLGGRLRLQEAVANGWRHMLVAHEGSSLDRHDRSELTARLWVA
jgi:hypothetical protein